jgi:hypothetical protein
VKIRIDILKSTEVDKSERNGRPDYATNVLFKRFASVIHHSPPFGISLRLALQRKTPEEPCGRITFVFRLRDVLAHHEYPSGAN